MKKYILLITILISTSCLHLHSQNDIDPPILPSGINDTIFSFDSTRIIHRMDDNFIIGWNYGGPGRAMDSLMKSNHYLEHWQTESSMTWANHGDNHKWYIRLWPLATGTDASIVQTQAIYYEPAIIIDKTDGFVPTAANAKQDLGIEVEKGFHPIRTWCENHLIKEVGLAPHIVVELLGPTQVIQRNHYVTALGGKVIENLVNE